MKPQKTRCVALTGLALVLVATGCSGGGGESVVPGGGGGQTSGSGGAGGRGGQSGGGQSGGNAGGSVGSAGSGGTSAGTGGAGTGGAGPAGGSGGGVAGGTGGTSGSGGTGAGGSVDGGVGTGGADGGGAEVGPTPSALGPAGYQCPTGVTFGNPLPAVKTATLIKSGYGELEGPVWVESQKALYFCEGGTSVNNGRIHKYTPADNKFVVFADGVGIGGLALDPQGMLVAASHDKQRLSRFDPATGTRTDVAGGSMYMAKPFNQVNDVVVRSDGNMYFSDPTYQLAGRPGQGVMGFYWLSKLGVVSRIVVANNANGVAISPDGAFLYLATTGGPKLARYALAADGTPSAPVAWKEASSDGIGVDCGGNVYLSDSDSGSQIRVISSTDAPVGSITGLGGGYVTNSAFGGEGRKTLFITTSTSLYRIDLTVPGFPN